MKTLIDLHTHTTASDGSLTPGELVRHAYKLGLGAIAITDHDTTAGIGEAMETGKNYGLEIVPGVEISTEFKPEMHILGYFFNGISPELDDVLIRLRQNRSERNPKIIEKLNNLGFNITIEEAMAEAKGNVVGRPHIGRVLLNKGYVKTMEEAFELYLAGGRPAYVKKDKLTPQEGIEAILNSGGIPVLAHPVLLRLEDAELDELLGELKLKGLKGMEAIYVENSEEDTKKLISLANKHNLLITGGSDFHGSFKTDIELGVGYGDLSVPYELLEKLKSS